MMATRGGGGGGGRNARMSTRVQGGGWGGPAGSAPRRPAPRAACGGATQAGKGEAATPPLNGSSVAEASATRACRPRAVQYMNANKGAEQQVSSGGQATRSGPERIRVREGLVVLRRFLDAETQQWLAGICFAMGDEASSRETGNTGFYTTATSTSGSTDADHGGAGPSKGILKLNMGTRGRMIDAMSSFPPRFAELCLQCLRAAQHVDDTMPDMEPNTLLINFYKPNANFKWHTDSENPQLVRIGRGKPVISFSIGLSCDFGYKDDYDSREHESIRLDSGDVFIFGGRSRMIVHSVLRVIPHTMPGYMRKHMREGRLNITFRDVDGFLDPTQFPRYRVTYDIEDTTQRSK